MLRQGNRKSPLKPTSHAILFVLFVSNVANTTRAVVLNFDDLGFGSIVSGTTYQGLTWELGNLGLDSYPGQWTTPMLSGGSYPHSAPHNLVNAYGSTVMGIGFPHPINVAGAYIAIQGGGNPDAYEIRVHGYLNGTETATTSVFTNVSTTPTWFDMSVLINVNRIVFDAAPQFEGQTYYGIDDLTFTYIPEPGSLTMIGLAGAGLLARRRG